jgi:peptide deformylase
MPVRRSPIGTGPRSRIPSRMRLAELEAWLSSSAAPAAIVQAGATVLRRRASDVPRSLLGTPALARLVEIMVETMRAAPGVGLAAPQIGVPLRLFVAEDDEERLQRVALESLAVRRRTPLPLTVVVNPKIELVAGTEEIFYEGCLSVRGYGALVGRAAAVNVQGVDPRGDAVSFRVEGWPARIMQHEGDHLDGTLYVDRMIARSLAGDAEMARLSGLPVSEVIRELVER